MEQPQSQKPENRDLQHAAYRFTDKILAPNGKPYKYTLMESAFVFYYLTTARFSATKAAQLAGYNCKNHNSFRQVAFQIMKRPSIRAAINQVMETMTMPRFEVLNRLGRLAAANIEDVTNEDGELDLEMCRENDTTFLLKKVKITRSRREIKSTSIDAPDDAPAELLESSILDEKIEFEIHNPLDALALLGKYYGLLNDRVELTGKDGQPVQVDKGPSVVVYLPDNGRGDAPEAIEAPKRLNGRVTKEKTITGDL